MAGWGKIDTKGLEAFSKRLSKLNEDTMRDFCKREAKGLAQRLLRKVIKRTPVDTGHLRGSWSATDVEELDDAYRITVYNSVEYAPYVEFGHRTRNHQGWVAGYFMLTKSEIEVDALAPKLLEQRLEKLISEVFANGK